MEMHERIRVLRVQKGLSQEQLAIMVGYNDRSSVAKVESGKVDISQTKIAAFAKALGVSPAYLLGLDDTSAKPKLTAEQQKVIDLTNKIIERLNTATPEQLETVSAILDAYLGK